MQGLKKCALLPMLTMLLMGCSAFEDPYVKAGTIGGVAGAGVGAGTGALIGSAISSGDIGASALLGGAIGLPAGILIGIAVQSYLHDSELEENNNRIAANHEYIVARQNDIDGLREEIETEYQSIRVDKDLRRDMYTGPTIGVYNR